MIAPGGAVRRYAGAALGPVAGAGAQFLLSWVLLARLDPGEFGRFAFLLVVVQLSLALASALIGAPLLVAAARGDGAGDDRAVPALVAACVTVLLPVALILGGIAMAVHLAPFPAALFGGYAALAVARAVARTWGYAARQAARTVTSDCAYAAVLLVATALVAVRPVASVAGALEALLVAAIVGLMPFLGSRLTEVLAALSPRDLAGYGAIWRRDTRWSLLGVLTTEATVNCHSYLVTALAGPAAFAPIAATGLLIRPITVGVNALVDFERARFARGLARGAVEEVRRGRRHLHIVLALLWGGTAAAAAGLLLFAPDVIAHGHYARATLVLGAVLWFAAAAARVIHAPEGAVLLAAGRFRQMAWVSVWTSFVSLAAVLAAILIVGPVWSIGGVMVGEACFAIALWIGAGRLLAARHGGEPA